MKQVTVYSTRICPYCMMAKRLLTQKGVPYEEIMVDGNDALRADLIARTHKEVDEVVMQAEATGQPDWRIMFEDVYSDLPDHLREQESFLRAEQTGVQL